MPECFRPLDPSCPHPICRDRALIIAIDIFLSGGMNLENHHLEVREVSELLQPPRDYCYVIDGVDRSWLVYAFLDSEDGFLCLPILAVVDKETGGLHYLGPVTN